jgi:hypothetical protein
MSLSENEGAIPWWLSTFYRTLAITSASVNNVWFTKILMDVGRFFMGEPLRILKPYQFRKSHSGANDTKAD